MKLAKQEGADFSFNDGAYTVTRGQDLGVDTVKITKKKKDSRVMSVNNIIHTFTTVENAGRVSFSEEPSVHVKLKGLEIGVVNDVPYKTVKASGNTLIVLNPGEDTSVVFIKRGQNDFDTKYFILKEVDGADGVVNGKNFNVNKNIYSELMSIIDKDTSEIKNKPC